LDSKVQTQKTILQESMYGRIYNRDETQLKVGSELIWLWWVAIEPTKDKEILSITISKERRICCCSRTYFLSNLLKEYDSHSVSTSDGGIWYLPQACQVLKLIYHLYSPFEKSVIERTMQYNKDKTESFDDYFPYKKRKCKLKHVQQWLISFADRYNKEITS